MSLLGLQDLLNDKADCILDMQNWCVAQIPIAAKSKPLIDAFLCGANIQEDFSRQIFVKTGLIHLLVVSGGHFAFLVTCLDFIFSPAFKKFPWLRFFKIPVLLSFSLMTGFQPPVVRALLALGLSVFNKYFRWQWSASKIQLASGLLILSFFPAWIYSLSFYLSWLASTGLCFPAFWRDNSLAQRNSRKTKWLQYISVCLVVQTLLSLFFWNFSWLSLGMNLLVAPLLMLILWPLCLILPIFPKLAPLVDLFWDWLLQSLNYSLQILPASTQNIDFQSLNWIFLWSLIFAVHCVLEIFSRQRFQKYHA